MFINSNTFNIRKFINRYRIIKAYNNNKTVINAKPIELILEITNACNLSCIMCPRVNMQRKVGYMDFELFKSIINQIKSDIELVYLF